MIANGRCDEIFRNNNNNNTQKNTCDKLRLNHNGKIQLPLITNWIENQRNIHKQKTTTNPILQAEFFNFILIAAYPIGAHQQQ